MLLCEGRPHIHSWCMAQLLKLWWPVQLSMLAAIRACIPELSKGISVAVAIAASPSCPNCECSPQLVCPTVPSCICSGSERICPQDSWWPSSVCIGVVLCIGLIIGYNLKIGVSKLAKVHGESRLPSVKDIAKQQVEEVKRRRVSNGLWEWFFLPHPV